jgi:hypothetical protein
VDPSFTTGSANARAGEDAACVGAATLMPEITPNQTSRGRRDATFRGTRKDPFAQHPAIEKSNRRKKRKLINEARRAVQADHIRMAARKLVAAKHRWERLGSAGREYEKGLQREFDEVFEDFRERYRATRAANAGTARGSLGSANAQESGTDA